MGVGQVEVLRSEIDVVRAKRAALGNQRRWVGLAAN